MRRVLLAAALTIACTNQAEIAQRSLAVTAAPASPIVVATPHPTLGVAAPPPSPRTAAPTPTPASRGIVAAGLGHVSGEWVFVVNAVPPRDGLSEDREIWAVRADGAIARRIGLYTPYWGGPIIGGTQGISLERQLSPDRRTLLLAAYVDPSGFALHAVDVSTGAVRRLTSDPQYIDSDPTWSPSGALIRFTRVRADADPREAREAQLWVMLADGSDQRRVPSQGQLVGFTRDERELCFTKDGSYSCVAIATGQLRSTSESDATPLAAPATPAAIPIAARGLTWNPARSEILYRVGTDALIYSASAGPRRIELTEAVRMATWSHDGSAIYVVTVENAIVPAGLVSVWSSLRRVTADGSREVELFRPYRTATGGLIDVKSVVFSPGPLPTGPSCTPQVSAAAPTVAPYQRRYDIGGLHREGYVVIGIAPCQDAEDVLRRHSLTARAVASSGPQGVEFRTVVTNDRYYLVKIPPGMEYKEAERLGALQPFDLDFVDLVWETTLGSALARTSVAPVVGPRGTTFALQFCCWPNAADVEKTFTTPDGRVVRLADKAQGDFTVRAGWGSGPNDALGTYEVRVAGIGLAAVQRFRIE